MTTTRLARPGAWRLGNWKEQLKDKEGIPMIAMWDTILPWSLPDPPPSFFPPTPPPHPPAPFEGYGRNETETEASQPNFPDPAPGKPGFRVVVLSTQGLKRSPKAPPRSGKRSDGSDRGQDDLTLFPFTLEDGYRLFLEYYRDNYLAPETKVIAVLPERDIRYLLQWDVVDEGSETDAEENFAGVIADTLEVLGDRLVGWYSVDEPELFEREEYWKEKDYPLRILEVRNKIRQYEREWRMATGNDPEFAALVDEERQWELLLPVLVTYSNRLFEIRAERRLQQATNFVPPEKWFTYFQIRDFADIHLYDKYPYKRVNHEMEVAPYNLRSEVKSAGYTDTETDDILRISETTTLKQDVRQVHDNFLLLRQELNQRRYPHTGRIPIADTLYRFAGLWVQAFGHPFDHSDAAPPGWTTTPAPNPPITRLVNPEVGPSYIEVDESRARRMPEPDELRFFAWLALFYRSEGFPVFAQYHASSQRLQERYWPLAQEISDYSDLRMFQNGATWRETYKVTVPDGVPEGDILAILLTYTKTEEVLLFICNRSTGPVNVTFEFNEVVSKIGTEDQIFRPYKFGAVDPDYPDLLAYEGSVTVTIPGERFGLFKREPKVAP
ncbi:MAG: hypothetical protein GEEBNDBF_01567 [bacterium]|nr:hypothetical protein [bacterium]